jgi:WD40 repeat protein
MIQQTYYWPYHRLHITCIAGHTEGITHLCPKGDGHHLISNSKDQTVKLWDVRKALSQSAAIEQARQRPQIPHWDYRWEEYPGVCKTAESLSHTQCCHWPSRYGLSLACAR